MPSGTGTLSFSAFALSTDLAINTTTGTITGTLPVGSAYESYIITVFTTDGTNSASQTFAMTVANPVTNEAVDDRSIAENDTIALQIDASTSTNIAPTYTVIGLPPCLTQYPATGSITGTISVGDEPQTYGVTVTVTDRTHTTETTFNWTVNGPITITVPATQTGREGDTVSLQTEANDPTNGTSSFSATGLPPGVSINVATIATGAAGVNTNYSNIVVTNGTYTSSRIGLTSGGVVLTSVLVK